MTGLPQANFGKETPEETAARTSSYKNVNYLTLPEGPSVIRFVGSYVFRHMHYYQGGKRPHIVCIGAETCPVCKLGFDASFYYYCNVLDRADEKLKVLRFGPGVKQRLDAIANKYGPLDTYDIEITRTGKNKETKYPSILPEPKSKPIADVTMNSITENLADLGDIYKIPTLSEVQDAMQPKGDDDTKPVASAPHTLASAVTTVIAAVTPKETPSGLATADTGVITPLAIGKLEKACYGDEKVFHPQREECIKCNLFHRGCKARVLAHYTGQVIAD